MDLLTIQVRWALGGLGIGMAIGALVFAKCPKCPDAGSCGSQAAAQITGTSPSRSVSTSSSSN